MKTLAIIFQVLWLSLTYSGFLMAQEKSNVLFIVVDDLNDYVSLLQDYPDIQTPNLDRLSRQGLTFTNAHTAAPKCNPSRVAFITGLGPNKTGVYNNSATPLEESEIALNSTFLPELFKQQGYITMRSGKILHRAISGTRRDLVWVEVSEMNDLGPQPTVPTIPQNFDRHNNFDYQEWTGPDTDFTDVVNTDVTIDRLQADYEKPFFMALGYHRPHNPWTVPKRYFDMYPPADQITLPSVLETDLNDVPARGVDLAGDGTLYSQLKGTVYYQGVVRAYLASITFMDDQLGRVLDALEKSQYAENTIVILFSDHGFHFGEKLHFAKSTLWERSSRSLMMVKAPGITTANTRYHGPASLLDIYPTLVDLCGLAPPPQELYGHSLRYMLEDPSASAKRYVNCTFRSQGRTSVRSNRWKYIEYGNGTGELYDLVEDPNEWTNLWNDPTYEDLQNRLSTWIPRNEEIPDYENAIFLAEGTDELPIEEGGIPLGEVNTSEYAIYPNPTEGKLSILSKEVPKNLAIYNLKGGLILSEANTSVLNVSSLATGTYILHLTDQKETIHTFKILHQKDNKR